MFVEKVRDIVGLYLNPPEHAVVLCVDEKTQVQALERTQPMLPMRPGLPGRATHDYKRNGTTRLFAALNLPADWWSPNSIAATGPLSFLDRDRSGRAWRPRRARGAGQLLHPQDPGHPPLGGGPPWLPLALHPDIVVVAQPGRALVRRAHPPPASAFCSPQCAGPRSRRSSLDRHLERGPSPLRVAQDGRRDPGLTPTIL